MEPEDLCLIFLNFLQIFGKKSSHFFELGRVLRVNVHQGLMGFQTGAGDFFFAGRRGRQGAGFRLIGQAEGAFIEFKKMQDTEAFQQLGYTRIRIEQFYRRGTLVLRRRAHFQTKPCQDSQKRAVHQRAFRQIQNEIAITLLP